MMVLTLMKKQEQEEQSLGYEDDDEDIPKDAKDAFCALMARCSSMRRAYIDLIKVLRRF